MTPFKVFIVDDHHMMREGLVLLLENESDIEVVGEADNEEELNRQLALILPDILLLNSSLLYSFEVPSLAPLLAISPETKVIVLSSLSADENVHQLLNDGAHGYIVKQAESAEIVEAMHKVMRGNYFLSPPVMDLVIQTYLEGTRTKPRGESPEENPYDGFNKLSKREKEVFDLLIEGLNSREISEKLSISPKTADKHRSSIYGKVGVENSTQLLHYAFNLNLLNNNLAANPPEPIFSFVGG